MKLNKILAAAVGSALLFSGASYSTGIPVIDAASLTQAITELMELQKHYEMLTSQFKEMQNVKNNLSGIHDLGDIKNALDGMTKLKDTGEKLMATAQSAAEILSEDGAAFYNAYIVTAICDDLKHASTREKCYQKERAHANQAGVNFTWFKDLEKHAQKLNELYNKARSASSAKEVADAQAAITAELGFYQVQKEQLNVLGRQLELIREEKQREQEAETMKAFSEPTASDLSASYKFTIH